MLPMLRVLAGQMPTLAEHAEAYVELAADEMAAATRQWSMRVALLAAAALIAAVAAGLGGVALMLWGALPQEPVGPARWLLWALPLGMGVIAVVTTAVAQNLPQHPAFGELRSQWRKDMALVRGDAASGVSPQPAAAP